ncbi:MAG: histone deacetylase [Acidobacteria bacterium]|nr:histone deacetylase [Acidobacteriota bacterium]
MRVLYYCDHHDIPLGAGHKFPMEKYRLIRRELERTPQFRFAPGPLVSRDDLIRVHDAAYVDAFLEGRLDASQVRRIGFPQVPELISRSLSSVGGTLAAAERSLIEGWSGVLAGGTHHAFRDFGSGFCVLNDIAVAARSLLDRSLVRRVLIVDLDVHQGDGTAAIFSEHPEVFTFSAHGRNNFPFRKQQSDWDLEFENGAEDDAYLSALAPALAQVFAQEFDIVFYQAGVDGLRSDRLGKLSLSADGIAARDRLVFEHVARLHIPCVVTLGGGYAEPIQDTVTAAANTYRLADQALCAMSATFSRPSQ